MFRKGDHGKIEMRKVSPASNVGECWLCGHGAFWHRLFAWFLRHEYDPIRELGYAEFKRLDEKYSGGDA